MRGNPEEAGDIKRGQGQVIATQGGMMLRTKRLWIGMLAAAGVLVAGSAFAEEKAAAKPAAKTPAKKAAASADEVAVMETSKGRMVIEFWPKDAPKTVANFKKLARSGFYNGTGFHRIIAGFMVQGGDPKSKNPKAPDLGTGGPGWTIPDEFNDHKHVKGVLSMAHTSEPNSGGSQFFLMHGTAGFLDRKYSAFGHVIEGMDVVDKIASVKTGPNPMMPNETSKPLEWVTIKSVKIMPRTAALAQSTAGEKAAAAKAAGQAKAAEAKSAPAAAVPETKPAASAEAKPAETPASDKASETAKGAAGGAAADSAKTN